MVCSNWQGAIWRGAMLVLLFWSGLAWTQPPSPAVDIVTVHEGGKSTRCRVLETWKLPDGRTAQLLEAIDTGEKITIVDEPGANVDTMKTPRAMPKRIFPWGQNRRISPESAPLPPHMIIDSGIVIKNDTPPPPGTVQVQGPIIVNKANDVPAPTVPYDIRKEGSITIVEKNPGGRTHPTLLDRLFAKREVVLQKPIDSQVVEFRPPAPTPTAPLIINDQPKPAVEPRPSLLPGVGQGPSRFDMPALPKSIEPVAPGAALPAAPLLPLAPSTALPAAPVQPNAPTTLLPTRSMPIQPLAPSTAVPTSGAPLVNPMVPLQPLAPSATVPTPGAPLVNPMVPQPSVVAPFAPGATKCDPANPNGCKPAETTAKKPWRPGANIQAWLQGKSKPSTPKTDIARTTPVKSDATNADPAKSEAAKTEAAKAEEARKNKAMQDYLAQHNKVAEKELAKNVEKLYGQPFSTAMQTPLPGAPQADKKPEAAPLAIPSGFPKSDKPFVLPPPPTTKDELAKPTEKRGMWGNPLTTPVPAPGRSLLDPALVKLPDPPVLKSNNPLMSPERLMANDDKVKKTGMLPPVARTTETGMMFNPPEFRPNANIGQPVNWPLGTQSVQAASSGVLGQPQYIPVPTVTVPQGNPPMPPPANIPEAPRLNAYVNAFTPPPPPKSVPQPQPMQGMMSQQAYAPYYGNPMMTQQQMVMNQQLMAQRQLMVQQQMMMQYGYRPSPQLLNPYMQAPMMAQQTPSQGPMTNFSRHYAGPMPPSPYIANPAMQAGYAPATYPPALPMHTMMPQPTMQPVGHQQQQMPTQQQGVTQQVEQLIKVLRESPYPAQREWAAQSLTSFEWRAHPQIVPAMIQSASQDPAASVRAGCVFCLGRMNAAVEPVFGVLHSMRNDIDPRVRQEVEQAFVRLGQAPMAPQ